MLKRFPEGSPGNLFGEFRRPLAVRSFDQILTLHGPPAQLSRPLGLQDCMNLHHHIIRFILYHSKIITFSQKDCVFSGFHKIIDKIFIFELGSPRVPRPSRWTYHCGNAFSKSDVVFYFRNGLYQVPRGFPEIFDHSCKYVFDFTKFWVFELKTRFANRKIVLLASGNTPFQIVIKIWTLYFWFVFRTLKTMLL